MTNESYRVMVVDDERIIREGIASLVDWQGMGLELAGCLKDGAAALEEMEQLRPDIVITDIKMPRMDGLELIKQAKERFPDMKFVVLSGYGEFRFASQAMKHGVKHYILKPCDEHDIKKVLTDIVNELDVESRERKALGQMERMLSEVVPRAREKLLSDYLLGRMTDDETADYLEQVRLHDGEGMLRLLACRTETELRYEEAKKLIPLIVEHLGEKHVKHYAVIHQVMVLLVANYSKTDLLERMEYTTTRLESEAGSKFIWSIGREGAMTDMPRAFEDAMRHMEQAYYLGERSITALRTEGSVDKAESPAVFAAAELDHYSGILDHIRIGSREGLNKELAALFSKLRQLRLSIGTTTGISIDLIAILHKQCVPNPTNEYLNHTVPILQMKTLGEVERYISEEAHSILDKYYGTPAARGKMAAHRMARYVHDNLEREELSLQWLAKHKLFMNPDYLGKLFRKEMKMSFPQYVAKARIEKAKEAIARSGDYKIYELAEMSGMGSDPKYFSNLFKKQTGCTPQEYKSRIAAERKGG
ncbi:response regulator [Paenibacillus sp. PAMC21692]|uniref:response regulator n=1 Tax=Paenibacillus sp. PAMC21692 TaxID=2762320 RepID=UPI00164E2AE1|nr:response regulator [Paenibacillus sp. PAMC21692]QNK58453.1 response regulator [Paenibacillus sp. PAMC21692]